MKYEISEFIPLILKKSSDFPVRHVGQIERSVHNDGILKKSSYSITLTPLFNCCQHFHSCQNFSFSSINCQLLEKLKNQPEN